ncbi:2-dehydropantoate 2-reductase [Alteromonas aestuariivivens]|uniref:2-dehydropantoate 2-reductase n=1 Tax=Alteromonas aestuariivivens TaxID=1938339 RepID=A0A3D8M7K5_9ALTE|nr:2-dehydropantoate 2-reductase [Alteromonas aestuariivivens]RDV25152.1 2-dehydropantoate 2-reductase [Alteromonas aestuariivivens]
MSRFGLRLQIVGSGAIGSLLAAGAQKSKVPYGLATRPAILPTQRVVLSNGDEVELKDNDGEKPKLSDSDILVLPLKVYQLKSAIAYWQPRMTPDTPVVLLHNGMGGLEILRQFLPAQPVYQATTSHGAIRQPNHSVQHTGNGHTLLGSATDVTKQNPELNSRIKLAFEQCLPPVQWQTDMKLALWQKLFVNAVINPLTALHNIRNGELGKPEYQPLIKQICTECQQVASACGASESLDNILQRVHQVIELTAANYSSMHQDVHHHRPTEIDAINGYLVKQAQKKGIDVPINTLLTEQIKNLG